ncbi:MAG: hypothetical protein ACTHKK_06525 [Candidatus Nitrosocosmicus sp.]
MDNTPNKEITKRYLSYKLKSLSKIKNWTLDTALNIPFKLDVKDSIVILRNYGLCITYI